MGFQPFVSTRRLQASRAWVTGPRCVAAYCNGNHRRKPVACLTLPPAACHCCRRPRWLPWAARARAAAPPCACSQTLHRPERKMEGRERSSLPPAYFLTPGCCSKPPHMHKAGNSRHSRRFGFGWRSGGNVDSHRHTSGRPPSTASITSGQWRSPCKAVNARLLVCPVASAELSTMLLPSASPWGCNAQQGNPAKQTLYSVHQRTRQEALHTEPAEVAAIQSGPGP